MTVLATTLFVGAIAFFVVGSVGLRSADHARLMEWITVVLPWTLLAIAAWGIWKKIPYALMVPVLVVSAAFAVYLGYDDPNPPPPPELGPIAPANSKSLETYRWLLKEDSRSRARSVERGAPLPEFPKDKATWPGFFTEHRTRFSQEWATDSLGREWVEAMARFVPEGMYPPPETTSSGLMSFSAVRRIASVRWARAEILMLDHQGDEAAELLLPLVKANYNLQRGGNLLVTQMIAVVLLRHTYEQLDRLVGTGSLSPETRSKVKNVLSEAPSMELVFHHAFMGEIVFQRLAIRETKGGYDEVVRYLALDRTATIPARHFLWRLLFNPYRSEREYAAYLHEVSRLATLRQLDAGKQLGGNFLESANTWHLKNPAGQVLKQMSAAAYDKIVTAFWDTEDRRVALLGRL